MSSFKIQKKIIESIDNHVKRVLQRAKDQESFLEHIMMTMPDLLPDLNTLFEIGMNPKIDRYLQKNHPDGFYLLIETLDHFNPRSRHRPYNVLMNSSESPDPINHYISTADQHRADLKSSVAFKSYK